MSNVPGTIDFRAQRQPVLIDTVANTPRVPEPPNHPFLLRHHPQHVDFEVITIEKKPQGYWLPALVPFSLLAGTNGIKLGPSGSGRPDYDYAKLLAEKKGWVFISEHETWQGEKVLTQFPCVNVRAGVEGTFYCTLFDTPIKIAGQDKVRLAHDNEADARWRHALVMSGKLPVPSEDAIKERLRQAEKKLSNLAKTTHKNAEAESYYAKWKERVVVMRTGIVPGADGDPLVSSAPQLTETKGGRRASP